MRIDGRMWLETITNELDNPPSGFEWRIFEQRAKSGEKVAIIYRKYETGAQQASDMKGSLIRSIGHTIGL